MRTLLGLLVLLIAVPGFSKEAQKESLCQQLFKQEDLSGKGFFLASRSCEISWLEKGKKMGVQLAFYQKGCIPYEGGKPRDCAQARVCVENKELIRRSTTIHKVSFEAGCTKNKKSIPLLHLGKEYKGPQVAATLHCKGAKSYVELSGNGAKKSCPLKF